MNHCYLEKNSHVEFNLSDTFLQNLWVCVQSLPLFPQTCKIRAKSLEEVKSRQKIESFQSSTFNWCLTRVSFSSIFSKHIRVHVQNEYASQEIILVREIHYTIDLQVLKKKIVVICYYHDNELLKGDRIKWLCRITNIFEPLILHLFSPLKQKINHF